MECPRYRLAKRLIKNNLVKRYEINYDELDDDDKYFEAEPEVILEIFLDNINKMKREQKRTEKNERFIHELVMWISNSANPELNKYY